MKKIITLIILIALAAVVFAQEYDLNDPSTDYSAIPPEQWKSLDQSQIPPDRISEIPPDSINIDQINSENRAKITAAQWGAGTNLQKCEDLRKYQNAQTALQTKFPGITNMNLQQGKEPGIKFDGNYLINGDYKLMLSMNDLSDLGAQVSSLNDGRFKVAAPAITLNNMGFNFNDAKDGYLVLGNGVGYAHVPNNEKMVFMPTDPSKAMTISPRGVSDGTDFIFDPTTGRHYDILGSGSYTGKDIEGQFGMSPELLDLYNKYGKAALPSLVNEFRKNSATGGERISDLGYDPSQIGITPRITIPNLPKDFGGSVTPVSVNVALLSLTAPNAKLDIYDNINTPANPRITLTTGYQAPNTNTQVAVVATSPVSNIQNPDLSITLSQQVKTGEHPYTIAVQGSNNPYWTGQGVSPQMNNDLKRIYGIQLFFEVKLP